MTFDTSPDGQPFNLLSSAVEIVGCPLALFAKISGEPTVTASKTVVYQNGNALETANCNSGRFFAKLKNACSA
jgi:hypothetical protein